MPQRSCCSPDTGVLYGTGQTVANVPGIMVTVGGAALVRIFNSWLPLFLGIAGIEVVAAALFATVAQIKPQHLGPQEQPALDEEEEDDLDDYFDPYEDEFGDGDGSDADDLAGPLGGANDEEVVDTQIPTPTITGTIRWIPFNPDPTF